MSSERNRQIDRDRLEAVRKRELQQFAARTRKSRALHERASKHMPAGVPMAWMNGLYRTPAIFVDHAEGSRFFDADGNAYLDFNVCDLAMTMGYGPVPVVQAVSRQMHKGAHFLLPTEDAIAVSEMLAERTGVPFWQFTLSASGANVEVMRIARFVTGRSRMVVFAGHYHGHIDETLVEDEDGESIPGLLGLRSDAAANTVVVPFNDLARLEDALRGGDVALVLTEPALTNCNVVLPEPGFLEGARELTRRYGTLLCLDEAHTFQFGYGGLVRDWSLDADFVVLGKGLGTGIAFGLYGMTADIAAVFEHHLDVDIGPGGLATGGTLYASAVAMAAARAALAQVLTPDAYERVRGLGRRLADGLDAIFADLGLPWKAFRLGPRSGYCLTDSLPRNYGEAADSLDYDFIDTRRAFFANRGIWDAVASAGPQASLAHRRRDIDRYLDTARAYLEEIVA